MCGLLATLQKLGLLIQPVVDPRGNSRKRCVNWKLLGNALFDIEKWPTEPNFFIE